jgi:DNA-binding CsgD family transcriptional regulator
MATNVLNTAPGYRSKIYVSDEAKINELAQMLAGYDDATWNRLKRNRRVTYVRAASTLFHGWAEFKAKFAEHAAFPVPQLTPRELEVLQWLSEGKNCSEIATILGTAHSTVSHQANMMQHKLEAVTAAQAVAEGFRKGLLK